MRSPFTDAAKAIIVIGVLLILIGYAFGQPGVVVSDGKGASITENGKEVLFGSPAEWAEYRAKRWGEPAPTVEQYRMSCPIRTETLKDSAAIKVERCAYATAPPKEAVAASVRVYNNWTRDSGFVGSGTVIAVLGDKALVLTCYHLFQDEDHGDRFVLGPIVVTFTDGRKVRGTLKGVDKTGKDLALIEIPADRQTVYVPLARDDVNGQVFKIGWPRGEQARYSWGTSSMQSERVMTSCAVDGGDSGGGLFRSDGKALIGVTTHKWKMSGSNGSYAVSAKASRAFAERVFLNCYCGQAARPAQPSVVVIPPPSYPTPPVALAPSTDPNVAMNLGSLNAKVDQILRNQAVAAATPPGCNCPNGGGGTLPTPPVIVYPTPPSNLPTYPTPGTRPTLPTPPPAVMPSVPSTDTLPTPPTMSYRPSMMQPLCPTGT